MSMPNETLDPLAATAVFGARDLGGADVEELDPQARRQLALAVLGRRAMATSNSWLLVLDALALATQTLDIEHCGISLVNPEGQTMTFRFGSQESVRKRAFLDEHYINAQQSQSLSRVALRAGHPVTVTDLSADNRIKDNILRQLKVASGIVCPLIYGTHAFGTWGVYSLQPRQFIKEEELFVETMGHMVTMAIVRQRAEDRARAMEELPEIALVRLLPSGQIQMINQVCQKTSGFMSSEVKGRSFAGTFLTPEDSAKVQKAMDTAVRDGAVVSCDSRMLTKQSERRRVRWSFQGLRRSDGVVESIVCVGLEASDKTGRTDGDRPAGANAERRRAQRRRYPYNQKIAPITNGKLPEMQKFFETTCYDVSASGFSFLAPLPPDYRELVVALGSHPSLIYVKAEVRHSTLTVENGQQIYLVGCQYTGRADY